MFFGHIAGVLIVVTLVIVIGIHSRKKVVSSSDFLIGSRKVGPFVISGIIIGTFIGGSATVGTVQLAYTTGLSAWWFTLGGGLACVALSLLVKPLSHFDFYTIPEIIENSFGQKASFVAIAFIILSMFFNVVPQILTVTWLVLSFVVVDSYICGVIATMLILAYILFGGIWGLGQIGLLKTFLLYVSMVFASGVALYFIGGIKDLTTSLPSFPWFSLFGRGFLNDLASGFSIVVGTVTSQPYIQAMLAGSDVKVSRKGAFMSAFLIPPIGLAGVIIGLFMRSNGVQIESQYVFQTFVFNYLNPWVGGIVIGTILITIMGTAAGLTLGISTLFVENIFKKFLRPKAKERELLAVSRGSIILIVLFATVIAMGNLSSVLLDWAYMSFAIRGATVFIPFLVALYTNCKLPSNLGMIAMVSAPVAIILFFWVWPTGYHPLYLGLVASSIAFLFLIPYRQVQNLRRRNC